MINRIRVGGLAGVGAATVDRVLGGHMNLARPRVRDVQPQGTVPQLAGGERTRACGGPERLGRS
jgi:hypothetical protein